MSHRLVMLWQDDLSGKPATQTRTIALDNVIVAVDVDDENASALEEFLGRFIAVGEPAAELRDRIYLPGSEAETDTRAYNASMRAWADSQGRGDGHKRGYNQKAGSGAYYYTRALRNDYEAFLRGNAQGRQDG